MTDFKKGDKVIARRPRMRPMRGTIYEKHSVLDAYWVTMGSNDHIQRFVYTRYLERVEDGKTNEAAPA